MGSGASSVAKGTFREVGGFVDMIGLLVRMKGKLQSVLGNALDHEMQAEWFRLFKVLHSSPIPYS